MKRSVLDLFVLSLLDRGLETPYDLLRAGLSLGASTPSLRRLLAHKLVSKVEIPLQGKRPRHRYKLTRSGKDTVAHVSQTLLKGGAAVDDIDALLRVVDMCVHSGTDHSQIASFLWEAANHRRRTANALAVPRIANPARWNYSELRLPVDAARLRAEAKALRALAGKLNPRLPKTSSSWRKPRRTK